MGSRGLLGGLGAHSWGLDAYSWGPVGFWGVLVPIHGVPLSLWGVLVPINGVSVPIRGVPSAHLGVLVGSWCPLMGSRGLLGGLGAHSWGPGAHLGVLVLS